MFAKEVMPGKFWILEDSVGSRKGTLRTDPNGEYYAVVDGTSKSYNNWTEMARELNIIANTIVETNEKTSSSNHNVHGYPVKCEPFNPIWDVKRKLPMFTKNSRSKSLHAAGYYIIHFEHGWVTSFCPKVVTLDSNEFQGPFKTKLEMRERLRKVNA